MQSRRPPDPVLAASLRRFRLRSGITQERLAFQAEVTISALSRIERGLSDPAWTTVHAITRALEVSLAELVTAVEQEQH